MSIEHDHTLPPIGKIVAAWVEERSDGEYQLIEEIELFESQILVALPDDTLGVSMESETDGRPFLNYGHVAPDDLRIIYDSTNFTNSEDEQAFVNAADRLGVTVNGDMIRHSAINDPEVIMNLSRSLIAVLLVKPLVTKVARDLLELYDIVHVASVNMARYAIPRNRPITYIFRAVGELTVEFAIRTTKPELVVAAIQEDNLRDAYGKTLEFHIKNKAVMVQFVYDKDEKWVFNYLLTATGGTIGSQASIARIERQFELSFPRNGIQTDNSTTATVPDWGAIAAVRTWQKDRWK